VVVVVVVVVECLGFG